MLDQWQRQTIIDDEHLRLLAIGYWVTAGLTCFVAAYGLIYIVMGVALVYAPEPAMGSRSGEALPAGIMGWLFAAIGLALTVTGAAVAALQVLTGFWIRRGRRRIACMIVAGLTCLGVPYGTVLGVLTIIVLSRASAAYRFEVADSAGAAVPPVA